MHNSTENAKKIQKIKKSDLNKKKSDLNRKNLIFFRFFIKNHDFFQPCFCGASVWCKAVCVDAANRFRRHKLQ